MASSPFPSIHSPSIPIPTIANSDRFNNEQSSSNAQNSSFSSKMPIFLRFYSSDGQRSTRLECDETTTCADICQHFSCDVITLQIGNYHFRQLKPDTSPTVILHDFCRILAMSEDNTDNKNNDYIFSYADSPSFRHIFSFFLGRPRVRTKSSMNSGILSEEVLIRKGKIIHNWNNAKAVFYNSNIRLQTKQNQDEVLQVRNMKVDIFDSKKGKALRLRSDDSSCYLLIFQRPNILQLWLSKAQQIEKSNQVDASDEHLTMIPEQILSNEAKIQVLNLRRNSLLSRPPSEKSLTPLGYVDDIYRIHSLQVIDLSANQILNFPIQLSLLPQLRQLNLSSNYISEIPKEVGNMRRIQNLNLSNNLLDSLPDEIGLCSNLKILDLSFNQLSQIPNCLYDLKVDMWRVAGNNIEKLDRVGEFPIEKVDLRRNILMTSFRLDIENITHLDIRDNSLISAVHLTNLRFLKVIHCERLQLTSLHLSGESLTHVFADNNLLDSIVVMPLPQYLQTLSLSYNHFKNLPDWICDCPQLTFLRANNNQLDALPERIFCSTSIRCIFAFNNSIPKIPEDYDENSLETFILYKNKISQLPKNFFGMCPRLRQLNLSSNLLELLPYFDGSVFCRMQILRLANNFLTEDSVPVIVNMKHLKVVDLSHNFFNSFDDSALLSLELLEEINLSSNRLSRLPDCFALLPSLQILRAHSNQLVYIPQFQNASRLQTLDVSSNNISLGTLKFQTPPSLRHVDVTCNSGDFVTDDAAVVKMNKINISDSQQNIFGFQIGVSGSRGSKNKQCIRQLRVDNTFVFIDGGSNYYMSSSICRFLSNHLRENANADIRSILLRCHCELGEEGERLGASVMILRLNEKVLEVSCTGTISATISIKQKMGTLINGRYEIDDDEYSRIREGHGFVDEENRINGIINCSRQLGHFSMFPVILPTHCYKTIQLDESIDGLIVANSALWTMISIDDVAEIFQNNRNPIVVAKKLQDKLQSFDYGGNSNILVMSRMKPAISFTDSNPTNNSSTISAVAIPALIVEELPPHPQIRSSKSPMSHHLQKYNHPQPTSTSSSISDTPIFSLTYSHPRSPSLPPTPSPPPLPQSTPPSIEYERVHLNSTSSTSSNIDRYYSNLISRRNFNETRDMLDKSLKLSPPNTITFHI